VFFRVFADKSPMKKAGHIDDADSLNQSKLIEILRKKIGSVDWESAKADMRAFIPDPERLDIWAPGFFLNLIDHLLVES
jgi:hypothetical protein